MPAPAPAIAGLDALEAAAHQIAKTEDCGATSRSIAALRNAPPLGASASRAVDANAVLRVRRITALQMIVSKQRGCDPRKR